MELSSIFLDTQDRVVYRGAECSDNLNASTIVISPSCRVLTVLIFVIFPEQRLSPMTKV
jgi:hypothetical protein